MSADESQPGLELVVGKDGSLPRISAETLSQYGLNRPGMRLGVVEIPRKSSRGILKGLIDDKAISNAMAKNKSERMSGVRDEDR